MWIDLVADFIAFLALRRHSYEEVLAHLTLNVFSPLECTASILSGIEPDGTFKTISNYGLPKDFFEIHNSNIRLTDKTPFTDSVTRRETIWIQTLPDWGDHYPALKKNVYDYGANTFVCWPITKFQTPVAVMGIFCKTDRVPSQDVNSFNRAVANLIALYFYSSENLISGISTDATMSKVAVTNLNELTERQQVILRLISEGKTNLFISEFLGYSESTIRQETIKIYSKLQCEGRQEAAQIYLNSHPEMQVS